MNAHDKIIKAKVMLQTEKPFFAYLIMRLRISEDNEQITTCGVNNNFEVIYNSEFINKMELEEVKTLLAHEVMHIVFEHLTRAKENEMDKQIANISADVVVNNLLVNNDFKFSGELLKGIVPRNNEIEIFKVKITDLENKTSDEVYNILNSELKEKEKEQTKGKGFDNHDYGKQKDENGETRTEQQMKQEVKQLLTDANTYAEMKGNKPRGLQRYIDELLSPKLNWREVLHRYITNTLMTDYDYNMSSKRSQAVGCYMPRLKKENIELSVLVDVSGSIDKKMMTEFLSEVAGMTNAHNNLKVNVLLWDTEIQSRTEIRNITDFENIELKGGGGTDFREIYNYLNNEIPNTKLLIMLTDGYADFPENEEIKTLIVLTGDIKENNISIGEVIRL